MLNIKLLKSTLLSLVTDEKEKHYSDYDFNELRSIGGNGYAILFYQGILCLKNTTF